MTTNPAADRQRGPMRVAETSAPDPSRQLAFENATVVVTGTTRGLGAAIRADLLARGASVIAADRHRTRPIAADHATRGTTRETTGGVAHDGAIEVHADWSDPDESKRCLAAAIDQLRNVSDRVNAIPERTRWLGLVHNAAMLGRIGPLGTLEADDIAGVVHINLTVALQLCNEVARLVRHDAIAARVLLVSSGAARKPYAGWSAYCATKSALDHLARTANLEAETTALPDGGSLVVHSLAPGVVDTEMQAAIRDTPTDRFPQRSRFVTLHDTGELLPPAVAARRLLDRWIDPAGPTIDAP